MHRPAVTSPATLIGSGEAVGAGVCSQMLAERPKRAGARRWPLQGCALNAVRRGRLGRQPGGSYLTPAGRAPTVGSLLESVDRLIDGPEVLLGPSQQSGGESVFERDGRPIGVVLIVPALTRRRAGDRHQLGPARGNRRPGLTAGLMEAMLRAASGDAAPARERQVAAGVEVHRRSLAAAAPTCGASFPHVLQARHRPREHNGRHARQRELREQGVNEGHQYCDSPEWRATVRDEIIPWAVGDVDLGDDVIEIGPGFGATTDVFAGALPRLTSVEIDPELAARLHERYDGTHVEVVLGDATDLEFPDGRFSGAVCFSMLHHVPSRELQDRVFAEVARVLRRGAPLVAVDGRESDGVRAFHEGDTYEPVDPATLPTRLQAAGLADVDVRVGEYGWTALARRA